MIGTWRDVANAARTTIRKDEGEGEPSMSWKRKILLAGHSPIRKLLFNWKWEDLPYWVSVHFVRHKYGIEHWVSTQRSDRTGEDRTEKPQNAPVNHECLANAEEVMFISRRRLCGQASPETREAWKAVVEEIRKVDPAVASCCVPECVYRGFCPEFKPCGFCGSPTYQKMLNEYRGIKLADSTAEPTLWRSDTVVYCKDLAEHENELRKHIDRIFSGKDVEVDWEFSGAGKYRFQAWLNRPEGIPLVSLKWEGC